MAKKFAYIGAGSFAFTRNLVRDLLTFPAFADCEIAILVNTTAAVENLMVEAAMEKNRRKVFQAVCMDPLTSAVCSLDEIKRMTDVLFEVNREFPGDYRR